MITQRSLSPHPQTNRTLTCNQSGFHCHASSFEWYCTLLYDYCLASIGSASNTAHRWTRPSLPINPRISPPPDGRQICPPEIQWLMIVRSRFYPIPLDERSPLSIHLIKRLMPIPSYLCICHAVLSFLTYPMHPKDKGGQCLVLSVIDHQQPHSRGNMAEQKRYIAEQVNTFNSYGTSSHITLHLPEKDSRAPEKIKSFTTASNYTQKFCQEVKTVGGPLLPLHSLNSRTFL